LPHQTRLNDPVGQTSIDGIEEDVTFQGIISAWVMGCEDIVTEVVEELESDLARRLRALQATEDGSFVDTSIGYVDLSPFQQDGANVGVTDPGPDVNNELLRTRLLEAFQKLGGILGLFGIDFDVDEPATSAPRVVGGQNAVNGDRVNAGVIVGAASAGLALLLLLILLIRRNRNADELSHLRLDEDDDDMFEKEIGNKRNAHIVGETDSIVTGWTGYTRDLNTSEDSSLMGPYGAGAEGHLGHPHGDVHICSSATCDVCERRRQQGLQFIPSRSSPPRPSSLPVDASREYVAEDTVEL